MLVSILQVCIVTDDWLQPFFLDIDMIAQSTHLAVLSLFLSIYVLLHLTSLFMLKLMQETSTFKVKHSLNILLK